MIIKDKYESLPSNYEKKNIFILTPCIYTALGIEELCDSYAEWGLSGIAQTTAELKKMLKRQSVNLLIIEAGYAAIDIGTLRLLSQQMEGRIILLMDETSSNLQEVYRIAGINIAVTKSLPLSVLRSLMHWMIYVPADALRPPLYGPTVY